MGSTNKCMTLGQLIIKKIIKTIATRCHTSRLKCTKFDSWRLSVCPFARYMEFDTFWMRRGMELGENRKSFFQIYLISPSDTPTEKALSNSMHFVQWRPLLNRSNYGNFCHYYGFNATKPHKSYWSVTHRSQSLEGLEVIDEFNGVI